MKYFLPVIISFFPIYIFAQDNNHASMDMDNTGYLPKIINHAIIKSWGASNLFKTKLDTSSLVYLRGEKEHTITIKAFKQKYYDDPGVLKPVWVLGYVSNESNLQPSLPGPVIVADYAHPTKIFWVNKQYESLQHQADYKLYPVYDSQAKIHPFIPIIYNVNDPMHVPLVADALYPDFRMFPNGVDPMHEAFMDMATYYSATVHLHGANVTWENDGYPTSKYYPTPGSAPVNITWGLFGKYEQNKTGQHYFYPNTFPEGEFGKIKNAMTGMPINQGNISKYEGHHGAILWYHDHAMMRTAPNVYSGQAGIYIINGNDEKLFSSFVKYKQDIPLILVDRSFTESNYLYYNTTTTLTASQNTPEEAGQPEFFGNTITVNGKIWPLMNVSNEMYRFRILNASNSRFYRLALAKWKNGKIDTTNNAQLKSNFIEVGSGGGFFPDGKFPRIGNDSSALTLAPAERADVLINFSAFEPGTSLVLLNYAPDGPFGDDELVEMNSDSTFSDLTNYVMLFHITSNNNLPAKMNESLLNDKLNKFSVSPVYQQTTASKHLFSYYNNSPVFKTNLQKSLQAKFSGIANGEIQLKPQLSSIFPAENNLLKNATPFKLKISEAASYKEMPEAYKKFVAANPMLQNDMSYPMAFLNETEWNLEAHTPTTNHSLQSEKTVTNYSSEIWAIWNSTGDAHPIHLHLNRFRILGRQKADEFGNPIPGIENFSLPEPNEMAWKDVVRAKPGYINYILVQFILYNPSQGGQFVYHCHILEHEDMSMMRRLVVKPISIIPKFVLASH